MCDTIVTVHPDRPVWIGKNSDREPGEVQVVERFIAAGHRAGATLSATHLELPQAAETGEVILSRPAWMWGCEMGVGAQGLAVANEAVFTRMPVAPVGLTGMDLQRLALERATTAVDALELIVELLGRYPQGGRTGYRQQGLRYHSSFILADPAEAWVLETAGELWAAERVRGVRTISNVLSIGRRFDLVHERAFALARDQGWCSSAKDFSFRRAFGSRFYRLATGGEVRRARTHRCLEAAGEELDAAALAAVLRDHGGSRPGRTGTPTSPASGWRMEMPCAHASWLPTRRAGQTTASMIARLGRRPRVWMTGTSSPCLSVFKPVAWGSDCPGEPPGEYPDGESLWWRHERLHRLTLGDYETRRAAFERSRAELEERALASDHDAGACRRLWAAHRQAIPGWFERAAATGRRRWRPFELYWGLQARRASA